MTGGPLDVTVIVVGFNDRDSLPGCIGALASDPAPGRIVVVDNASTDGTGEILGDLASTDPRVESISNDENLGYAGAVNTALPTITSEYVAVLNADTAPSAGWLAPQIEYLKDHADVGATSPTVTVKDSGLLNAAGLDIHLTGLAFNRLLHRSVAEAGTTPVEVPGIQGTAFVVRRDLLEAGGGWYSKGFLYHEDAELSWTLRLMGYRIAFVPTPPVEHGYVLTMSPEKLFLLERNRWEMLLANTESGTRWKLAPLLLWTEIMMWGYCALRGSAMLAAKWRSYGSVRQRRRVIAARRTVIDGLRQVSDGEVLDSLRSNYNWDQLLFLGRRRATRGRRGGRDLPVR